MPRHTEEQAFGSDSFLDVVANVVGVLIILMVVVGVRVGRAPVLIPLAPVARPTPAPAPPVASIAPVAPPPVELEPLIITEPAPPAPPPRVIVVEQPLPQLPAAAPSPELTASAARLRTDIQKLTESRGALDRQLASAAQRASQLQSQQAELARTKQARAAQRQTASQEAAAARQELAATQQQLAELQAGLVDLDAPPAPVEVQHRISPLGRTVSGSELHFYLSRGGVASVPVEQLSARLKLQIERQKDLLVKMDRYEGDVDPIDGFRMHYVIQKSRLSLTEELKFGSNIVRMQVSQWALLPEPDLQLEPVEAALQRGSDFYQALLAAGPTTALTFWVYPDSFAACAQLKEFAHRHGYEVAARPLPEGVPIMGSPDGSKSIAQ